MPDPTITGDFSVLGPIRRGPAGVVLRATRRSTGAAVGLIKLEAADISVDGLQSYLADVQKLVGLRHAHVVEVAEVGSIQDSPYVVLSSPDAVPMASALPRLHLTLPQRIALMLQVAQGLRWLHSLGIAHRAVSLQSLLLDQSVALVSEPGPPRHGNWSRYESRTHEILLSDGNAAPEQVEGHEATLASDVFAFGAVLYQVVAGVHPFHSEHLVSVLYNTVHNSPVPMQQRVASCPDDLALLVAQCLHKNPSERPRDMAEVARVLEKIQADAETLPGPEVPVPSPTPVVVPSGRRDSYPPSTGLAHNPYLNRTMIRRAEEFVGRTLEVKRIYARLNASPPGSISIIGDRKIGKSSLLNYVYMQTNRIQWLAAPDKTVMLFIDLQQETSLTMATLIRSIMRTAKLELGGSLDFDSLDHTLEGLREMVLRLDKENLRLVVILDEFERITGNSAFPLEFFSFLRYLANHYNVAYLTSSSKELQSLCHERAIADSPFFNIFTTMHLSSMTEDEALELITVPSQSTGHPLAGHSTEILGMSGRFPYFIQLACSHTLEVLDEERQVDWEEVRRRFCQEAQGHYRFLWDGFAPAEREVLGRLAHGTKIPESLGHIVEQLSIRGYVSRSGDRPCIYAHPFLDFVRRVTRKTSRFKGRGLRVAVLLAMLAPLGVGLWAIRSRVENVAGTRGDPRGPRGGESTGRVPGIPAERVNLRLLAVGVSKYGAATYSLAHSDDDARDLVAAFKDQSTLFDVDAQLLVNEEATKANILRQLRRICTVATQHDLVVLTVSGHGDVDRGNQFYFLPYDYKPDEEFGVSAISKQDFLAYLADIPCPVLVLLDTCHSGEFARGSFRGGNPTGNMDRAVRSAMEEFSQVDKGMVVMAACLSRENAEESPSWGHGALTLAFLEAMRGRYLYEKRVRTKLPADSILTLSDLDYYVTKRVSELVGGSQRVKTANLDDLSLRSITLAVRRGSRGP